MHKDELKQIVNILQEHQSMNLKLINELSETLASNKIKNENVCIFIKLL